ncbi:MAG: type II toxin-antitoxin system HicB family antitoxin [Nanoarchaeota archaeon]|nr:type II toxin-antitoxin system HicB family antitoxin [Nanoarchaeota archaeon]
MLMARKFHVLIEKDEDGGYVGKVLELKGCVSQGDTIEELMENIKEAVELCLEVVSEGQPEDANFVGVREVEV